MLLLTAAILFQVTAAKPTATPTPAPVSSAPRTLADVARERKLKTAKKPGTFSVAGVPVAKPLTFDASPSPSASDAQARMDKAVADFQWAATHIHYNETIKASVEHEWDAAAENCRQTNGCNPTYRPSSAHIW